MTTRVVISHPVAGFHPGDVTDLPDDMASSYLAEGYARLYNAGGSPAVLLPVVLSGSPQDGQVAVWVAARARWEPQTPTAGPGGAGPAVTSVAGRTGAVVLAVGDVSGLGTAATQPAGAFDPAGAAAGLALVLGG